ncbi:MAG: DUF86 domain-containing protein [Chloroflexi bacterium]|nr:DUF86 domain-containing protein [Chloroflexota bacterium]
MSRRDPYVPIMHMLDNARDARNLYAERSRRGDWDADPILREALNAALIRYMEIIGEAARRVPQGLRACYPDIDWPRIVGLRNRLIHEYDTVSLPLLSLIIRNELPPLIGQLERMLDDRDKGA